MRRDGALADRVVPRGHVARDGHAEAARSGEIRHGDVRLEVRHHEPVAPGAHRLQQRRRHVPPAGEEPRRQRTVDGVPARQMARAVDVEKRDRVAVLPASFVEAVAKARADGDRVEPDVVVEEDVRPAHDPLAERHAQVG